MFSWGSNFEQSLPSLIERLRRTCEIIFHFGIGQRGFANGHPFLIIHSIPYHPILGRHGGMGLDFIRWNEPNTGAWVGCRNQRSGSRPVSSYPGMKSSSYPGMKSSQSWVSFKDVFQDPEYEILDPKYFLARSEYYFRKSFWNKKVIFNCFFVLLAFAVFERYSWVPEIAFWISPQSIIEFPKLYSGYFFKKNIFSPNCIQRCPSLLSVCLFRFSFSLLYFFLGFRVS